MVASKQLSPACAARRFVGRPKQPLCTNRRSKICQSRLGHTENGSGLYGRLNRRGFGCYGAVTGEEEAR